MNETYLKRSRAVARVIHAAQQLFRAVNTLVRRHDLTESQYNALRILRGADRRGEDLTQADLAQRLIASRANTTWILDKLEERKLVRRKGHADRRKNLIEITAAGQKLLARIDPEFEKLLAEILRDVSDAELTAMQAAVDKFRFDD
ncbi:MAG: MarR family transcriptional regulator [Planctomycetes bacterium]|nr:MarR family transcriptional regulator [Planctomycetota bacterium]MCL4731737.1 MarR family transcriptional regulator [Planctomycetota bacterium]